MRRRHATSPGISGHYRDLRIGSRKTHDSTCKLIISMANNPGLHVSQLAVLRSHDDPAAAIAGQPWPRFNKQQGFSIVVSTSAGRNGLLIVVGCWCHRGHNIWRATTHHGYTRAIGPRRRHPRPRTLILRLLVSNSIIYKVF